MESQALDMFHLHPTFGNFSLTGLLYDFSHSGDIIAGVEIEKLVT